MALSSMDIPEILENLDIIALLKVDLEGFVNYHLPLRGLRFLPDVERFWEER